MLPDATPVPGMYSPEQQQHLVAEIRRLSTDAPQVGAPDALRAFIRVFEEDCAFLDIRNPAQERIAAAWERHRDGMRALAALSPERAPLEVERALTELAAQWEREADDLRGEDGRTARAIRSCLEELRAALASPSPATPRLCACRMTGCPDCDPAHPHHHAAPAERAPEVEPTALVRILNLAGSPVNGATVERQFANALGALAEVERIAAAALASGPSPVQPEPQGETLDAYLARRFPWHERDGRTAHAHAVHLLETFCEEIIRLTNVKNALLMPAAPQEPQGERVRCESMHAFHRCDRTAGHGGMDAAWDATRRTNLHWVADDAALAGSTPTREDGGRGLHAFAADVYSHLLAEEQGEVSEAAHAQLRERALHLRDESAPVSRSLGAPTRDGERIEAGSRLRYMHPATILDPDEHRECHDCGESLAGRQAHFNEEGEAFCVDHADLPRAPTREGEAGGERRVPQRGEPVAVRYADGGALDYAVAVSWFVEPGDGPIHLRVCSVGSLGLAGWKRRLHWDADGTPWVHEYAMDGEEAGVIRIRREVPRG